MKKDNKKKLQQRLELLQEYQRRKNSPINSIFPSDGPLSREHYPKHMEFFKAGATYTQRVFMAGNRTGKSEAGAVEICYHVTGVYPEWWEGRRFDKPVKIWVAGYRAQDTADVIQAKLTGTFGDSDSGFIQPHLIEKTTSKTGIPNAINDLYIRHISGGISHIGFKSHKEGREAFQGARVDVVWLDEECPVDVYQESLMRVMATTPGEDNGLLILTFTPLMGLTGLVRKLIEDNKSVHVTSATWDDAPHLSEKVKEELLNQYPPHIREARTRGIPYLGAGTIYPVLEDSYVIDPIEIQDHWYIAYGLDVGWKNTSAVFCAHDRDNDIVYVYGEYIGEQQHAAVNAQSIKARGNMLGAVDTSSANPGAHDGLKVIDIYNQMGLELKPADKAVEAGISRVWERLQSGRLKVFKTCTGFLKEIRVYHRDEKGKIVKNNDHLMDALRYYINTGIHLGQPKALTQNPRYDAEDFYDEYLVDDDYSQTGGY